MKFDSQYTAEQTEKLLDNSIGAKIFFSVPDVSIYVCTGSISSEHDGETYRVDRSISLKEHFEHGKPTEIELSNTDGVISTLKFSSGTFSQLEAFLHFYLQLNSGGWIYIGTALYVIKSCAWSAESFKFVLKYSGMVRKKACLSVCGVRCDLVNQYKGELCQSASSDDNCNGSWEDCTSKSNTVHFRGVRAARKPGETIQISVNQINVSSPIRYDPYPGGHNDRQRRPLSPVALRLPQAVQNPNESPASDSTQTLINGAIQLAQQAG